MPSVTVSRIIAAPREEVWAVLSDIPNARRWNAAWSGIDITSPQTHGAGATFRATTTDGQSFDFAVTDWVEPQYISFSPIRRESERYPITLECHAFRLLDTEDGRTEVELTAQASVHGIRGRFIAFLFWRGHQTQGLEQALDSIQALFEPGADEREAEGASPSTD